MRLRTEIRRIASHEFREGLWNTVQRGSMEALAVIGPHPPNTASHNRIALSSIASKTGARSPGEELMTCNTSAVAVCCSSASRVSPISRAFSMDHRLSGEGVDERDPLSVNGPTRWRANTQ